MKQTVNGIHLYMKQKVGKIKDRLVEKYYFDVKEQTESCINWIRDWFNANGNSNTKCVLGVSGGKDSNIVAALLVKALGADRVIGVMLPCGNQIDIDDSKKLIKHLGIKSYEINIGEAYDALTKQMRKVSENGSVFPTDGYSTNTPARLRMTTLYGVGAIIGNCRVVNTGNLSEGVQFYYTIFGDHSGDFAPIEMFTTDEVMAIGDYLGLPYDLVHKTPSDGMSIKEDGTLKCDEDKLGVSYSDINRLIRLGDESLDSFNTIMDNYNRSKFKEHLIHFPHYEPDLPNYFKK